MVCQDFCQRSFGFEQKFGSRSVDIIYIHISYRNRIYGYCEGFTIQYMDFEGLYTSMYYNIVSRSDSYPWKETLHVRSKEVIKANTVENPRIDFGC